MRGVADQHHVVRAPAAVADRHEVDPLGVVGDQLVALERIGEQLTAERDRADVRDPGGQTARRPSRASPARRQISSPTSTMNVEDPLVVRVGVRLEHPGRRLLDEELERVVREVDSHPHVLAMARIERRLEIDGAGGADRARGAVGGDDQVGPAELIERWRLGLEQDLDPELGRSPLQDRQQLAAAERREAMSSRSRSRAAVMDVDVGPVGEPVGDRAIAERIGVLEHGQRLIGEDDPEAERVLRPVALEHRDLAVGVDPAHQNREVQAGRPATDYRDAHRQRAHRPRSGRCSYSSASPLTA